MSKGAKKEHKHKKKANKQKGGVTSPKSDASRSPSPKKTKKDKKHQRK